jgi:hypothetical protein
MKNDYVIWTYKSEPDAAVLKKLTGLEKVFRLQNGTHLQDGFPSDVAYHMHPDFPNDIALVDNMLNLDRVIVASPRLSKVMKKRKLPHVEYLPLTIIDHKGRAASKDYCIIHPVDLVDCIDLERSVYKKGAILPGSIDSVTRLVLDESRIPADRQLFKLRGFREVTVAHRDLADALDEENFTGLTWQRIQDYPRKSS